MLTANNHTAEESDRLPFAPTSRFDRATMGIGMFLFTLRPMEFMAFQYSLRIGPFTPLTYKEPPVETADMLDGRLPTPRTRSIDGARGVLTSLACPTA